MKRAISLILLMIVLFLGVEMIVTRLTRSYEVNYKLHKDNLNFEINEKYNKKNSDTYELNIKVEDKEFYFGIKNSFNKQKKIIKDIEYFKDGDNMCIYPVLKNKVESYILCLSGNSLYSSYTYPNQDFINNIRNSLKDKGYITDKINDLDEKVSYNHNTLYKNNLKSTDTVLIWQYKGIYYLNKNKQTNLMSLTFDKYENKVGVLVGKYYLIPNYTNSRVLEFSSYNVINLESLKQTQLNLDYTLSSDTYINCIVDGKLYVTEPSNLIQLEINPGSKKVRLLGDKDQGGKTYDGTWKDANIYDFQSREIKFKNLENVPEYSYVNIVEGGSSYYYYTSDGNIYQILKGHLDQPILLYRTGNINNFNIIDDDIYYVVNNTLYSFNMIDGNKDILVNNDLIYNTNNRVSIYRNN